MRLWICQRLHQSILMTKEIIGLLLYNIKIGGKLYKNILIYYIGYLAPNSVKPLYLIINNKNGYIAESTVSKYLILVPTDESKDNLKKYEEIWSKTKDLTRSLLVDKSKKRKKHSDGVTMQ